MTASAFLHSHGPGGAASRCAAIGIVMALASCGGSTTRPVVPQEPTHDVIFEGYFTTTPEVLRLDAVTGGVRRLVAPGLTVMDPEPAPDGARIAFVVADYSSSTGDIFVMNRDGTGINQLTTESELDDHPSWSPDGRRIAFRSYRTGRAGDIWVMDDEGGNAVNLTPDPLPGITDEGRPAWSPNGLRIAYAGTAGGDSDIWTMAVDGSDPQRITSTPDFDTEPAWAPDGATLAFRRCNPDSGCDVFLVPATGGTPVRLRQPGDQRMPAWTPDGARLVLVSQASLGARPDLYIMRRDGTDFRPLVTDSVALGCLNPAYLRRR